MNPAESLRNDPEIVSIAAGAEIFRAGEPGTVMYILIEGNADVMIGGMTVEAAGPGAILGEMALVSNTGRSATVMARTACRVLAVNAERFDALIHEKPGFARHVMRVMAERLQNMNQKLLEALRAAK